MKIRAPAFVVLLFASCGDGKKQAAEQLADTTTTANASYVIDLAAHDLPLSVDLGDRTTLGADTASVVWNEEFGHLRVNAGERFAITITEAPGDIARLKADLYRDMLREHTVIEETPDKLVYRLQYPDEDLVFVHIHQEITVGDRTFIVEDAAEGRFNEADIKRMAGAVRVKEAI